MQNKLDILSTMFDKDTKRNQFKKHIEYIRFPYFKNYKEDLKVNFEFPLVMITGSNGSGKSSFLHALYGSVEGNNISEFWFTTSLDPITELKENRNCFIYSYTTEFSKQKVEVIKTRIQRTHTGSTAINPEAWEPSRALKKFNMTNLPDNYDPREASATRWKLLNRKVYYMDFRYSLSAFDKYFYFGSKPIHSKIKTKQDLIRFHSDRLKSSFSHDIGNSYYSKKSSAPIVYSIGELEVINWILGKNYIEAKMLEHNYYENESGFAIRFITDNMTYSEAFAGSGEIAISKLVHDIYNVEDYSLILLDEPETSLHPAAQKRLIEFLVDQIILKKLQVVISTHSPDILHDMPKRAIKLFYENSIDKKIHVIEDIYPENAFIHLGHSIIGKRKIVVEDILAKEIIVRILKDRNDLELFEVDFIPGGESRLKQENMLVYSKTDNSNNFIIFDGDQRTEKIDTDYIYDGEKNETDLNEKIYNLVGENIKFYPDSGSKESKEEQRVSMMLKYINYHNKNVYYLPRNIPEEIIWSDEVLSKADLLEVQKEEIIAEACYKKKFNLFAQYNFGNNTSEQQMTAYKYFLERFIRNKENEDYHEICKIIDDIKNYH